MEVDVLDTGVEQSAYNISWSNRSGAALKTGVALRYLSSQVVVAARSAFPDAGVVVFERTGSGWKGKAVKPANQLIADARAERVADCTASSSSPEGSYTATLGAAEYTLTVSSTAVPNSYSVTWVPPVGSDLAGVAVTDVNADTMVCTIGAMKPDLLLWDFGKDSVVTGVSVGEECGETPEIMTKYRIEGRYQLIAALNQAVALEQMLMIQYIYAAVSIRDRPIDYPDMPDSFEYARQARDWKRSLMDVARQEMRHMGFALNLLTAVGGSPNVQPPNMPSTSGFYVTREGGEGIPMTLERFSLETMERFVRFEAEGPTALELNEAEEEEEAPAAVSFLGTVAEEAVGLAGVPPQALYNSVSDFYFAILTAMEEMEAAGNPPIVVIDGQNVPIEQGQTVKTELKTPPLEKPWIMQNITDAQRIIEAIVEQGEGSSGSDPSAHINIFRKIYLELRKWPEGVDPAHPVVPNPHVRPSSRVELSRNATFISSRDDDGKPYKALQIFNSAYSILLRWLYQVFGNVGSQAERNALTSVVYLPFMSEVIMPLAEWLITLEYQGSPRLGPGFELPELVNDAPSSGGAVMLVSLELLDDLQESCDEVARLYGEKGGRVAYVAESVRKTRDQLRQRMLNFGQYNPPRFQWDKTYSEIPSDNPKAPQEGAEGVLALDFSGWCMIRLPTDPDASNQPIGVSGNTFSFGSEPPLDRIIRFQLNETETDLLHRSFCPPIGVDVRTATLDGKSMNELVGAKLDLMTIFGGGADTIITDNPDNPPKLAGRNHLIALDGQEPIDPMVLRISKGSWAMQREAKGDLTADGYAYKSIPDMTPAQQIGTGRLGVLSFNLDENVAAIRKLDPDFPSDMQIYVDHRQDALNREREKFCRDTDLETAACSLTLSRLKDLERNVEKDEEQYIPQNIRRKRYTFVDEYDHLLSGNAESCGCTPVKLDPTAPWHVIYTLCFYDTDALSCFVHGKVLLQTS
ncbi:unnamed protein product [Chrysoparadoxa australica]